MESAGFTLCLDDSKGELYHECDACLISSVSELECEWIGNDFTFTTFAQANSLLWADADNAERQKKKKPKKVFPNDLKYFWARHMTRHFHFQFSSDRLVSQLPAVCGLCSVLPDG